MSAGANPAAASCDFSVRVAVTNRSALLGSTRRYRLDSAPPPAASMSASGTAPASQIERSSRMRDEVARDGHVGCRHLLSRETEAAHVAALEPAAIEDVEAGRRGKRRPPLCAGGDADARQKGDSGSWLSRLS